MALILLTTLHMMHPEASLFQKWMVHIPGQMEQQAQPLLLLRTRHQQAASEVQDEAESSVQVTDAYGSDPPLTSITILKSQRLPSSNLPLP